MGNRRRRRELDEQDQEGASCSKINSMDRRVNKFHGHGSPLKGAILMSNYATKQECLQRNLFGLPQSMIRFIERIKAGMLLFFFEYEERKLYGVFEATSNGSRNIVPNAFTSLGHVLPAQILFKRIWMCKPLSEDEFCHAIEDNYFKREKFHFGLSYDQVFKLVQLFYIKRIDLKMQQKSGIPNEIIKEFDKRSRRNKFRKVRRAGGTNQGSEEHRTNNSGTNQSGRSRNSASQTGPSNSGKFSECHTYGHHSYHGLPVSGGESSTYPPLPPDFVAYIGSSMDMNSHLFNGQLCASHTGPNPILLPPLNLMGPSCPICIPSGISISLPTASSEGHPNFHGCTEHYDPSHPRISFSLGITTEKGKLSLPLLPPGSPHGHPEALTQRLESGGQPSQGLEPPSGYVPPLGADCSDRNVESAQKDMPCQYPALMNPRIHSDTEHIKLSVFSHLTEAPEACYLSKIREARCLSNSQKASQKNERQKPVTSLSIDQLERILLQRREHLIQLAKLRKQSIIRGKGEMELRKASSPAELQLSNDVFAEDTTAAGSREHMVSNFRDGSNIQKFSGENEMGVYAESDLDEGAPQNYKRRKLVNSPLREECQYVQGSTQGIPGDDIMVENCEINIESGELSYTNQLDMNKQTILSSETSPGNVALDKNDKTSEGSSIHQLDPMNNISVSSIVDSESLRSRKKEISNRNLQWFLQKCVGHESDKTNDASLAVSEVVAQPTDTDDGSEGADGITAINIPSSATDKKTC